MTNMLKLKTTKAMNFSHELEEHTFIKILQEAKNKISYSMIV